MLNGRVRTRALFSLFAAGTIAGCAIEPDADEADDGGDTVAQRVAPDPDRHIVKFRPGGAAQGRAAVAAAGGTELTGIHGVEALSAHLPAAAVAALANHPLVEYVEPDVAREKLGSGTEESSPYGIAMVQADQLSDAYAGNRKLCIIDSGYARFHQDLEGNDVAGTNVSGTGNWFEDKDGHGSHVAGTIAARGGNGKGVVGVNPGGTLKLHILKVFGDDGTWAYSSSLVSAANLCRDAGAHIISMSLGGSRGSKTEENAFNTLYNTNGILSVAAAGNAGNTAHSYPASYSSVISVAALDANKVVADFSQKTNQVELAAPGVGVLSTVGYVDDNTLIAGGGSWAGGWVEGAAYTTASGVTALLADGGKCTTTSAAWSGKIVLCQRGDISFADKVKNVASSGGLAAVIYNNVASDPSCGEFGATLSGSSTIPAISIPCAAGAAALTHVGTSGTVVSLPRDYTKSGYSAFNGTSMATPHVSGVAALVWSYNPSWTNAQIRDALRKSAQDLGAAGRDNEYGHGLVQAKAALDFLTAAGPIDPPPPPPDEPPPPSGDTTPPVISAVSSAKVSGNKFRITWTTDELATSEVRFTGGASGTFTSTTLVTSHQQTFTGSKGVTYTYVVASTDAAGNRSESGPHTHKN
jgi:serine protease